MLFKDGMLVVYSYLQVKEIQSVITTCKSWYATALSEKSRGVYYLIQSYAHLSTKIYSSVLRFHIGICDTDDQYKVRFSFDGLILLFEKLWSLTTADLRLADKADNALSSALIVFGPNLKELRLNFHDASTSFTHCVFDSIGPSPTITSLTLNEMPDDISLEPIRRSIAVSQLNIFHRDYYRLTNVAVQLGALQGIPQQTSLEINGARALSILVKHLHETNATFPSIATIEFLWNDNEFDSDMAMDMLYVFPLLQELSPRQFIVSRHAGIISLQLPFFAVVRGAADSSSRSTTG